MQIVIVSNNASGLYNFRIEVVEELILNNHKVYFFVPEDKNDAYVKRIISTGAVHVQTKLDRRSMNPIKDVKLMSIYYRKLKEVKPNIILTYTVKPNIYGSLMAHILRIPVVSNITGMGSGIYNLSTKYILHFLYKISIKKNKHVFFQNEHNRSYFLNNSLIDDNKSSIIPGSGVNTNKFSPEPVEKKLDWNILFVGRIMREKGIEEFIELANVYKNSPLQITFNILGKFEEDKYKEMILASNNNVNYLGTTTNVKKYIAECDCLINPSYHEGMSNVLLEAAAMEKILIASNIPGCKEIIDYGRNGYLFDVKSSESLKEVFNSFVKLNDFERKMMGKASREKVIKEFERKIVIQKYLEVINE